MSIDKQTLYYLELAGPGWLLKSISLSNPSEIETIGSMQSGRPLAIRFVPKAKSVFVIADSGVHQFSTERKQRHFFLSADIRTLATSDRKPVAVSGDQKYLAVASVYGWIFLFNIEDGEIRQKAVRDFTVGLPKSQPTNDIREYNEYSAKWSAIQITALEFRNNELLVGTWAGKLLTLDITNLSTTVEAKVLGRYNNSFGRVSSIYSTPVYVFLALEGGGANYLLNKNEGDRNNQYVLPDHDIQMGQIVDISLSGISLINILGKSREVARIECCVNYSLVARDTPLPGGGRATIVREGYFDLTAKETSNFKEIIYQFGEKQGSILDVFDVLYRPDIVRKKLKGEDIAPLIGEMTITKALKSPPPTITGFSAPKSDITTERIRIPYTIKSEGGGVGEVLVLHNGKLIKSDGYYKDAPGSTMIALNTTKATSSEEVAKGMRKMLGAGESNASAAGTGGNRDSVVVRQAKPKTLNAAGEYSDSVEIDVISGEDNEITVMARNQDNTILGQGQTVRFKSSLPKAEPHLWILPVGIASFQDSGVRKLASPKKDALDFACSYGGKEALKNAGINCDKPGYAGSLFKNSNIHAVDPLTNEKATRANILAKLDEIAARAKPTDTFIWFVSSHGTMDANSVYGIVPFDAKCQDPKCDAASGLVSSNDILEKSKAIKAMKQLLILDTCQAGGLDNKMSGLYDARMSGLAKNMGLHLYAAATATESALDGQDANKNSIFTATLLEGLAGASAKNTEGQISIVPLGQYVKTKTPEASRKAYANMTPQTPVIQHFGKDAPLAIFK
jgi:hypothetical protein